MALPKSMQEKISGSNNAGTQRVLAQQKANVAQSNASQSGNQNSGSSKSTQSSSGGTVGSSSSGSSQPSTGKNAVDVIKSNRNSSGSGGTVGSGYSSGSSSGGSGSSGGTNRVWDTSHSVKVNGREMSGEEYATYQNLMEQGKTAWQRNENAADYWARAAAMTGNDNWGLYTYDNGVWTATGKTDYGGQAGVKANAGGKSGSQSRITNPSTVVGAQYTFADALNDATNNQGQSYNGGGTVKAAVSGTNTVSLDDYLNRQGNNQVYTDAVLSQGAQATINQAKREWQEAYARGDQAGMDAARWKAERARMAEGYYSNPDGTGLRKYTNDVLNQRISQNSSDWFNADPTRQNLLHEQNEYYRSLMGYSGGADGSQRITLTNQGTPDYTGMNYQQKYAAAKAAGDTYGMAEAANDAYNDRYNNQGVYRGVDGAQAPVNVAPVLSNINTLKSQLTAAQSRGGGDANAITSLKNQIKQQYASIGRVWDKTTNQDYARTELELRIEQDKRDWWTKHNAGDFAGAQQAHEDAVWADRLLGYTRNADGTLRTPIEEQFRTVGNNAGGVMEVGYDANGKPTVTINPSTGQPDPTMRGFYTDPYSKEQYIVKTGTNGNQEFVRVIDAVPQIYQINPDGSRNQAQFTDAYGNTLDTSQLVYGEDNRCYSKTDGRSLYDLASDFGLDPTNFIVEIKYPDGSTKYFNLNGSDAGNRMDTLQRQDVQDYENQTLNDFTNALLGAGYNNVPQWSDFDTLTWDQALAQATEQVNTAFNDKLDSTLDQMNTNALQTGFYGQLPTEQLRQSAVAESEVERQQAAYELANQLMTASQTEAQRQFGDAMQTSTQRINTVVTLFQQVYQMLRDKVTDAQQEESFDIQRQGQAITREANYLNYYLSTFQGMMEVLGYCVQAIASPSEFGNTGPASNLYNTWSNNLQTPQNMLASGIAEKVVSDANGKAAQATS